MIQSYLLVQYQFQNDLFVIRGMDDAAKEGHRNGQGQGHDR